MGDDKGRRYAAFLSYSHRDAADARWLHRRLESYRLPRRLAGSQGEHGSVPARFTPVFRDREDLRASGSLSESVRTALAASDNLIVICSPHSAASEWVAKEISLFRELHPGRPVLAAIVAGDPAECFPPNLPPADDAEPLAADLRPHRDGRRLGFLKLVAGLAGVGLDQLVQRDAQRRIRRVMAVTAAAVAAMLAMAVMTTLALNARAEAQHQRAEAEGLVEFMLTDLRTKLKGAAGLEVLTTVNRRALDYYRKQELDVLPADSLERRARILHAMGEDDELRRNLPRALAQFQEAARTTAALLAQDPEDAQRIYNHAQSEYWVGSVAYVRSDLDSAKAAFERYRALALRLLAIDPDKPEWLKEAGYAEGNLCTISLARKKDAAEALRICAASAGYMKRAAAGSDDLDTALDLANRYGWLADAYRLSGDWQAAARQRQAQQEILKPLVAAHPDNALVKERWALFQLAVADLYSDRDRPLSMESLARALTTFEQMVRLDPTNDELRQRRDQVAGRIAKLSKDGGDHG